MSNLNAGRPLSTTADESDRQVAEEELQEAIDAGRALLGLMKAAGSDDSLRAIVPLLRVVVEKVDRAADAAFHVIRSPRQ